MIRREVIIGDARLLLADCMEVLPTLEVVDALVCDPPYGINKDGQKRTNGGHGGRKAHEFLGWDGHRPSSVVFEALLYSAQTHIIWGGNYFADLLPPTMKWLVWDKGQRINQSDGELAWTSMQTALRICTMNRIELLMDGAEHPTQKPVRLMNWCLSLIPSAKTILDPFMGSGTTGVSCIQKGRSFIGIEREEKYFEIACRRIEQAAAQGQLFEPAPQKQVQEPLV